MDQGATAALLYGLASSGMTFANKSLFAVNFPYVSVVLLLQMAFTVCALKAMKYLGKVNFSDFSFPLGKRLWFASAMYCSNVGFALTSLGGLSIPVYQVLKRMTPAAACFLAFVVLGKKPSTRIVGAISMICFGTLIMGFGDLMFNAEAYFYGLGSVISQALYLTYVEKSGCDKDLDTMTVLYANSINCIPILLAMSLINGDLMACLKGNEIHQGNVWITLSIILTMGTFLNYTLFLCTMVNSALATTIVGVFKAVLVSLLGFFTFNGQPITELLLLGMIFNTSGAIYYAYVKYDEKRKSSVHKYTDLTEQVATSDSKV